MAQDINVEILLPVENFVVFKNKIRKEMSETPEEDLEMYKKFEWERAVGWWGNSWNNIKNNRVDLNLLVQIRDLLGYSWETHPITNNEIDALNEREREKRLAELKKQQEEALAAWNALTPEEQQFELRSKFIHKLFGMAIATVLIVGGFLLVKDNITTYPYPAEGCPTNHFWDEKEGVCKKYYNLP